MVPWPFMQKNTQDNFNLYWKTLRMNSSEFMAWNRTNRTQYHIIFSHNFHKVAVAQNSYFSSTVFVLLISVICFFLPSFICSIYSVSHLFIFLKEINSTVFSLNFHIHSFPCYEKMTKIKTRQTYVSWEDGGGEVEAWITTE
jgi:hypothetical protein